VVSVSLLRSQQGFLFGLGGLAVLVISAHTLAQSLGPQPATKANLDLPFNAAGESSEEENSPGVLSFYGSSYEASTVVFVLDASGSMSEDGRWPLLIRETSRAIRELQPDTKFSIVFYESILKVFKHQLVEASDVNRNSGIAFLTTKEAEGGTCTTLGVLEGLRLLKQSDATHKALIVTSDGAPDGCGAGPERMQLARIRAKNPGGRVGIHTLWVGSRNHNEAGTGFLQLLARENNGTFRFVSH